MTEYLRIGNLSIIQCQKFILSPTPLHCSIVVFVCLYFGLVQQACFSNVVSVCPIHWPCRSVMQFLVGREGQRPVTKLSRCPKRPISWTSPDGTIGIFFILICFIVNSSRASTGFFFL